MRTIATHGLRFQRRWQRTTLLVLGILSVFFTAIMAASPIWMWPVGIAALLIGGFVAAARRDRRREGGSVAFTSDGLEVALPGRAAPLTIARGEVNAGYAVPHERSVELKLTGGRKLVVETSDPDALLAHLGQAVGQRALTMPLRGTIGAFVLGLGTFAVGVPTFVLGFGALFRMVVPDLVPAAVAVVLSLLSTMTAVVLVVRRFGHPRVVVGADGVRVLGTLAQPFVPYAAIGHVTPHPTGVQIALRDGRYVQLETYGQSGAQISALALRIEQGRAACVPNGTALGALQRGGRSLQAWQDDVRRMALAPPGFRDQVFSRDDFERIVADASAPPDQRIGAALALRVADPDARPRIRVAATASANDDLRAALHACAAGEEAIDDAILERATAERR